MAAPDQRVHGDDDSTNTMVQACNPSTEMADSSFFVDMLFPDDLLEQYSSVPGDLTDSVPHNSLGWSPPCLYSAPTSAIDDTQMVAGQWQTGDGWTHIRYELPQLTTPIFPLERLDPVEALYVEIRDLLKSVGPVVNEETSSTYVTRANLILFSELCSRHFLQQLPILHVPSFHLVNTPPMLLIAIFVAGACFADDQMPVDAIHEIGMGLLKVIENQPVSNLNIVRFVVLLSITTYLARSANAGATPVDNPSKRDRLRGSCLLAGRKGLQVCFELLSEDCFREYFRRIHVCGLTGDTPDGNEMWDTGYSRSERLDKYKRGGFPMVDVDCSRNEEQVGV